jgi:hypothetical protein
MLLANRAFAQPARHVILIPFGHSLRFDMASWNWFGGPVNFAFACF